MPTGILHDGVEFLEVPGFHGYAVSRCGLLVSNRRGKWRRLLGYVSNLGYVVHVLYDGLGGKFPKLLHRLVLEAWSGSPPVAGMFALHGDGNSLNNCIENLRWGTQKENYADSVGHGTNSRGEKHGCSTMTVAIVREIRHLREGGMTYKAIGAMVGVTKDAARDVGAGETWAQV